MKKILLLIVATALLSACEDERTPEWYDGRSTTDQCMRTKLFKECMTLLPKGPEKVNIANDWDEVVNECNSVARRLSYRPEKFVKEECRERITIRRN